MKSLSDYFYRGPVITHNNGRELNLKRIDQGLAYAHMLEGIPYGRNYAGLVNLHLGWAQERHPNRNIICLEPRLRPLPLPEEDLARLRIGCDDKNESADDCDLDEDAVDVRSLERLISGMNRKIELVSVGSVCCRALIESTPMDERAGMLSELIVIWFQDGFAMPIEPAVIEQIRSIDWEHEAQDVDL